MKIATAHTDVSEQTLEATLPQWAYCDDAHFQREKDLLFSKELVLCSP